MGLSLRAAAKALDISHVALIKARDAGRCSPEADGTWDVEKTRAALEQNSHTEKQRSGRAQRGRPRPDKESGPKLPAEHSQAEALRQETWEKVRARRLENELKEGRLVELPTINAYVAGMILRARDELIRIGPELRDDLARQADPLVCQELIDRRIQRVLGALKEFRLAVATERQNAA